MYILYGIRQIRIRKFHDTQTPCSVCGGYHKEYTVRQPCFHFFWIPLFPIPGKNIEGFCKECRNLQPDAAQHPEMRRTRTPLYTFIGIILAVAFVGFGIIGAVNDKKNTPRYAAAPLEGDVYLLKNSREGSNAYYFSRILAVEPDSVYMQVGAYDYTRYVSRMDKDDYYVEDLLYAVHKSDLTDWLDQGIVREITRKKEITHKNENK